MQKETLQTQEMMVSLLKQILDTLLKFAPVQTEEVWLDNTDVKELLKISDPTLYRLRKSNQLPAKKIGGKWYYSKSDLLRLIRG